MKKTYMLILSLICILCLFSAAAAYDSLFDKPNNTSSEAVPFKSIKKGLIPTGQSTEPDTKSVSPFRLRQPDRISSDDFFQPQSF